MSSFLHQLLNPRSIAILGASNNIMTMGTGQLYTLKSRFKGKIYPIHPREKIVLGLPAFQNLEDIPEVPDLLVVVLPTRLVLDYLERAGKFGVPFVIIVSAGFSEIGKQTDQEKINEIANKYSMRVIGPNCIGVINTHSQNGLLNCTWFPFELPEGQVGNISLASQSGSWISQILIWAERRGIRFGKAISVGNEANVDITDCLRYFSDDSQTKVVGLYIEGIKRQGRNFITTLQELTKKKPVVVSYAGGTVAGSRAGMSHTASLGGKPEIYDTIFKQSGTIRTQSMEELYEYLHAFSLTYPPKGDRIGLITNSGGPAVSLADSCEKNGLNVVSFSEELTERLKSVIPSVASANNPIDLTFDLDFNLFYHEVPHLVWESNEVDALIFYGAFGASALKRTLEFGKNEFVELFPLEAMNFLLTEALEKFVEWVHSEKVPLVISCIDTGDEILEFLQKNGISVFKWPSMTVKAMRAVINYYTRKKL